MNKSNLIIIAEDDDEIAAILTGYLHRAGMKTCRAEDGEQAINLTRLHKPDLVLLDIHLPVYDGWNVLTTLRKETNVPVIMVTALDQDVDKLMGLRLGADDYVIKPFNPSEVIARVEAVLRRTRPNAEVANSRPLRLPFLTIYPDEFYVEITVENKIVTPVLTTTEFKLLTYGAQSAKGVLTRRVTRCLPARGDSLDRTVDSHMSKLRKSLNTRGSKASRRASEEWAIG